MRDAFFDELLRLFKQDSRVVFLTGDLGYKLYDPLKEADPARVINFGIREASMVGFAAGLAGAGMLPVVYSIVPFVTLRCLEQIKLELCYNRNRVTVVGVGGGYAYGKNGSTHHGIEDYGLMRAMGGMRVFTPCDPWEVRGCVCVLPELDGPAYIRLGRNGERRIRQEALPPSPDEPFYLPGRGQGIILTCSVLLSEVLSAVELLAKQGIHPAVAHLPCVSPLPAEFLKRCVHGVGPVLVAEEHVGPGGLAEALALFLLESGVTAPFASRSIPAAFPQRCQSRDELLSAAGLDASSLADTFSRLWADGV